MPIRHYLISIDEDRLSDELRRKLGETTGTRRLDGLKKILNRTSTGLDGAIDDIDLLDPEHDLSIERRRRIDKQRRQA